MRAFGRRLVTGSGSNPAKKIGVPLESLEVVVPRNPVVLRAGPASSPISQTLVDAKPTTRAGMLAVMKYASEEIALSGDFEDHEAAFPETLLEAHGASAASAAISPR